MKNSLKTYLDAVEVGEKQIYKNLAVYPLLSDYAVTLAYLTLDEALEQEVVEVAEVDADGTVPELNVVNRSDQAVLILDGEELVAPSKTASSTPLSWWPPARLSGLFRSAFSQSAGSVGRLR